MGSADITTAPPPADQDGETSTSTATADLARLIANQWEDPREIIGEIDAAHAVALLDACKARRSSTAGHGFLRLLHVEQKLQRVAVGLGVVLERVAEGGAA